MDLYACRRTYIRGFPQPAASCKDSPRYPPRYRSGNTLKIHSKSAHDKFKTVSKDLSCISLFCIIFAWTLFINL